MASTSRRLSRMGKKPGSQTPGKLKGESCQRSKLKDHGRSARGYKNHDMYERYCALIDGMNKASK